MSNDSRPADNIAYLADYLWWLLPAFLKKKDRSESLIGRLCDVWGTELGQARTTLTEIIPLLVVATASGVWLDKLARARQILRSQGESDESLRIRVLAAHELKRKGGTIPGMVEGLAAIGYGVAVEEPNISTDTWSRFVVRVLTWNGLVADQNVFYSVVRQLKPAHTRALVESELTSATWDDWAVGDPEERLDEGLLDDWIPTE